MQERHSVRQYKNQALEASIVARLEAELAACNQESGLNIQLVTDEPRAFDNFMAHYGKFRGVKNYIALIGQKRKGLEEQCGYYGERLVLKAQQLGLNTCWVGLTYRKISGAFQISSDEKLVLIIALGYGKDQGHAHKSKDASKVSNLNHQSPAWFEAGVAAALLAPTAMNQQKFMLICEGSQVTARAGKGFFAKVDLGIVKYHFEIAAGKNNFQWN
ncbi:nitroreductase family protein [Peptococcus simiae]|uniref:nitroreductase family protein n=1 Tax=Peptococcus simiae TaxID=1643805 RepID=UPI00397EA216